MIRAAVSFRFGVILLLAVNRKTWATCGLEPLENSRIAVTGYSTTHKLNFRKLGSSVVSGVQPNRVEWS